jgi:hypothetical protein
MALLGKDYQPGGEIERMTREREAVAPADAPKSEFYASPIYHGFMTRGELKNPVMREQIELGVQRSCEFFNKCIPPPVTAESLQIVVSESTEAVTPESIQTVPAEDIAV